MTVSSTLELRDSFSNTIEKIVNAVNHTVSAMEQMRENMESPINDEAFKSARAAVDHMNDSIREMEVTMSGANSGTDAFTEAVERTETAAKATETASKQLGEGIGKAGEEGQNASQGFMSTADSISQMLIAAGGYKILGFVKDGLVSAASAAIEFESAVTGIYKTVDGTKEQLQGLSDAAMTLASQMPATSTEIAGVMEAAGQLGIATNNVASFAKTMIDLGESTNLTSDAAASMLAKFANVTQMDPSYYENLGSVIVDLGNNFATTEQDIVNMSSYLASAGTLAGFTQTDILGLSAAMSSVGIEAEAGGSAMSKLITKMQVAVETGDGLIDFASTADMTAQQFADTFENNAVGALQAFITGLNDVERNGASASVILKEMDLDDIRLSNTIRALASSNGLMSSAVSTASQAWEENNALANEANKRYATLESKIQMTKNSANNLKIAVGDALTPALSKLNDMGKGALDWLTDFAKENKAVTAGVTGFAGSIGVLVGGLTTVVPIASQATQAFMSLKNSMAMKIAAQQGISVADAASQAGSKLAGLAGKFGLVAGGISLAVGLTAALVTAFSNAEDAVEDYNGTLEECKREMSGVSEQYDAVVRMYGENSDAAKQLSGQLDTLNKQYEKGGGAIADYAQRAEDAKNKLKQFKDTYNEQLRAAENSAVSGQIAVAQLQAISEKAVITNSDLDMMGKYADYLNNTFRCNIEVDYSTGKLTGFNPNDAASLVIAQAEENRKNVAVQNYTSSDTQNKYIEYYKDYTQAKKMYEELQSFYDDYYGETPWQAEMQGGADYVGWRNTYQELAEKKKNFEDLKSSYESLFSEMQGMAVAGGVGESFDEYIDYLNAIADGTINARTNVRTFADDAADSTKSMADIISEHKAQLEDGAIQNALQGIAQELGKTAEKYDEVYKAAYESFSKQYELFENAEESYKKTTEEIVKDGDSVIQNYIDSANAQKEYFSRINESIQTLSATSSADIGVSRQEWDEFLDYASQLPTTAGEKGAAVVNAFADAINSGDNSKVKDALRAWQDNEKAMQDTSKNIGLEVSDMEQALQKGEQAVTRSLQNIGMKAPTAYDKAKSVVDSLARGVGDGYSYLSTQVSAIEGLMSRLASFNVSVNLDKKGKVVDEGYATGTLNAAPGLALVGENGPELISFGGGEVVYTADQTRRILGDRPQNFLPTGYYTETLPDEDEKDTPHISDDDMKYLREMTEREVLNKIYQPQITNKIEMSNSISSEADIDVIIHELSEKLIDAMAVTAEGVHI